MHSSIPPPTAGRPNTDAAPFSYRHDPDVPGFDDERPIIIFDGICVLCAGWASFVLRHDHKHQYRLLTAQSALGKALYTHFGLDTEHYETNILLRNL